jgi:hypothetical protein
MNIQQLLDCADVLGEMSNNFTALPADKANAVLAGANCMMARLCVLELAKHLTDGMEPYDAFVATANGELEIPESTALVLKVLTAKPNK